MEQAELFEADWPLLLTLLPADLEESARTYGAFIRRRGVKSPADLLRLVLAYAADGSSLRTVAAEATSQSWAELSDVALLKRLRKAGPWLGYLLTHLLAARQVELPQATADPVRLRLLDATTVSRPGSKGTDWRIHLGFNLERLLLDHVEVTEAEGGETLKRAQAAPGEVWIADRGYAHRAGIVHCVAAGAALIVRLNWQNVPLQHPDGRPFDLLAALRSLPTAGVGDFAVQTAPHPREGLPAVPGRVVALRKSPEQAEAARRKLQQAARKKGKQPDVRTLEAAGYVFLFTTLVGAGWPALQVLELYRFRWQIELAFKRLKSLLDLDELTAKDPALCRAFLLGKLLLYCLTERLTHGETLFSPWGYGSPQRVPALATDPNRVSNGVPDRAARPYPRGMATLPCDADPAAPGASPAAGLTSHSSVARRATDP